MRIAQINKDGYCYAVSEISGDIVPDGTIELSESENPIGKIRNADLIWSEFEYVMIQKLDVVDELAQLKEKLVKMGIVL